VKKFKNGEFPGGVPRGREVNKKKGGGSVEKMFRKDWGLVNFWGVYV
jgi:hypothetical protein